jgi:flagellar basal-body rod modification protein FlgD
MTAAINGVNSPTTTPSTANTAANGTSANGVLNFTQNFNTFLTLLTTQLQNQDPLNPMDSSQFTNQLVEFSQVEQQIKTNSQLSTMITNQTASETISAQTMVGDTIQYNGSQAALENSNATWSYDLPSNAQSVTLNVLDSSGNIVYSTSGQTTAGTYPFSWNGQTSSGKQESNGGIYTLQVSAKDANGNPLTATTTAVGTITGVNVQNNVATFDVAGVEVPMSQLVSIVNTPSSPSGSSSSN